MAKFTRSNFVAGAAQALSQQNFPAVYKNAVAALALGATPATYYLCAYHYHQIQEGMRTGATALVTEATANFGIMYQLSENFQIQGYNQFTPAYQGIFSSKIRPAVKITVGNMVAEYTKYLQATQMQYSEGTAVDIRTAEQIASTMEQAVLQQAAQNSQAQSFEMSAPPPVAHGYHDPHHHHPEQAPLIGHDHHSKWCPPCVLL